MKKYSFIFVLLLSVTSILNLNSIVISDSLETTQISTSSRYIYSLKAYKNTVAWHDTCNIFYWNGINILQVTNNDSECSSSLIGNISLYNGKIAWNDYYGVDSDYEIYFWDGNNISQISNNDLNDYSPSLYKETIAWSCSDGNDTEICYWDGASVKQITDNNYDDNFVSLYKGQIAWHSNKRELVENTDVLVDSQIFFWDGEKIIKITDSNERSEFNSYPSLFDGKIAWQRYTTTQLRGSNHYHSRLCFWDGNQINEIATYNSTQDLGPHLYKNNIIWIDHDGNDYEIYYWDGYNKFQITDNIIDDWAVCYHTDIIAWKREINNGLEREIVYANISNIFPNNSQESNAESSNDESGCFIKSLIHTNF